MTDTLKQWEQDNKPMLNPPNTAWPTVLLFICSFILFFIMVFGVLLNKITLLWAIPVNAIAQYCMFTVLHDASHRSLSQHSFFNDVIGSIAAFILSPIAGIRVFRFIHMQHHRFTNEGGALDPDEWCGRGRWYTLPFRWMTLDIHYLFWYSKYWSKRPIKERIELITGLMLASIILAVAFHTHTLTTLALVWLLPARIAVTWLALAFDFLPHYPHDVTASQSELQASTVHPTYLWLMTPVMLGQNLHLIHHLYPRVPFYRYINIWFSAKTALISNGARLMTWYGQEISRMH